METFYVTKVSIINFLFPFKKLSTDALAIFAAMNEVLPPTKKNNDFRISKLFQYFLQGLLIIAPITITLYAIYWVVSSIDNMIPIFYTQAPDGRIIVRNYGLGFLIVIATICLIGYLSSFFIKLKMFSLFEAMMARTPGIRFIYTTVKEFFEAFAGEKKKFNKPVLANIDDNDVWRVGFITQEDVNDFHFNEFKDYVAVYIPNSYSIAGNVYLLPRNRVKPITNINATDAMKFAISGGVTHLEEIKEVSNNKQ
jgi:uncharacterized membrane protein